MWLHIEIHLKLWLISGHTPSCFLAGRSVMTSGEEILFGKWNNEETRGESNKMHMFSLCMSSTHEVVLCAITLLFSMIIMCPWLLFKVAWQIRNTAILNEFWVYLWSLNHISILGVMEAWERWDDRHFWLTTRFISYLSNTEQLRFLDPLFFIISFINQANKIYNCLLKYLKHLWFLVWTLVWTI